MLLDKEFVLSDSGWNCYNFRLLTSGYVLSEYAKNPIGYYMHQREDGVLVRWNNVRIEGDKIIGTPDINLNNPRGQQTVEEVNNGFLNAASMGHFVVLESDVDVALINDGKTKVTITKWYNRECSLCDVPANPEALALYDKNDNLINLRFPLTNPTTSQKHTPKADEPKIDVDEVLKKAIDDKSINKETANELKMQYAHNAQKLVELIEALAKQRIAYLMSLEWNELDKQDLLEELKEKDFAGFKQKFFNAFHKEYSGRKGGKAAFNEDEIDISSLLSYHIKNNGLEPDVAADLKRNYKDNPKKLKDILEGFAKNRIQQLMDMSWDELDKKGLLAELKEKSLIDYQKKFKERFSVEHSSVKQ